MRHIKPFKLKVMTAAFLGTGGVGILMGLNFNAFYVTFLGVINLCLGGFTGWLFFTQAPKLRDKRKKK